MTNASALIAWAALAEGADSVASWLVDELGPTTALVWLRDAASDPVAATMQLAPRADAKTIDKAVAATEPWLARLGEIDPARDVRRARAAQRAW